MYRRRYASIPNDWKVKKIKDISEQVFAGGTPSTRKPEYWDGDIPWMSSGEINKKFIFNTDRRITKEGYESSSTKMVPKNSVLIALAGQGKTRGTVGMNKIELCTNQSIASIVPPDTVDSKFLYYNLDSRYDELRRLSTGDGGRGGLNLQIIKNIFVALPSLEEQRKITSILSTWDKAIELKEKLIEQKKEQKKGLMQKLLTGEVRLPGFNGEWKEVKLGYLGECIRGVSYKPGDLYPEDNRNSVRLLRSNNIKDDILNNEDIQYVDKSKAKEKQLLRKNDLVISMANGSKKLVGKSGVFNSLYNYAYTVGAFCAIFRFNDRCSPNYAKYLFQTNKYNYYVQNLMAGSNINNLKPSDIESMKFSIPAEKNEQDGIATILDTTTKEIKYLNKEIVLLKQQKKGLMQLLLTGKVRVKV